MSEIPGSGVSIGYELDELLGDLTVTMWGPNVLLGRFSTPSEVIVSYMMNLEAAGLEVTWMDAVRVRINQNTGIFEIVWSGRVEVQKLTLDRMVQETNETLRLA